MPQNRPVGIKIPVGNIPGGRGKADPAQARVGGLPPETVVRGVATPSGSGSSECSHWVVRWLSLAWTCSLVPFIHSSFFPQSTTIHRILLEITFSAKPFCLLQRQGLRTEDILSVCTLPLWPVIQALYFMQETGLSPSGQRRAATLI